MRMCDGSIKELVYIYVLRLRATSPSTRRSKSKTLDLPLAPLQNKRKVGQRQVL